MSSSRRSTDEAASDAGAVNAPDDVGQRWGLALLLVWAVFSLANVWSHRAYEPLAVVVFVLSLAFLAVLMWRREPLRVPSTRASAVVLAVLAVGSVLVFQPTYMSSDDAVLMRLTALGCTLAIGAVWLTASRLVVPITLSLTGVVLIATAWWPIRGVPIPGNDVWFILQQGIEGTWRGDNMYRLTWTGVPTGQVQDAFTYLPMSAVLLAPARGLTGDVRWGLALAVSGCAAVLLWATARPSVPRWLPASVVPACLLVLTPGHPLQVEMAWTEPLILLLVLGAVAATTGRRHALAVVLLALALAAKQHVWLLLPLMACWRPLGPKRTVAAAGGAVLLMLPWVVADADALWDDTVGYFLDLAENDRSSTVYAALEHLGGSLPLPVAVVLLLGALVATALQVRRPEAGAATFLLGAAVVLLVANLVNQQAFYNQWWLVGSLLLGALAFSEHDGDVASRELPPVAGGVT